MNFINNSFWLTDECYIQFTPIAKRNKIIPVKTGQKLMPPLAAFLYSSEVSILFSSS